MTLRESFEAFRLWANEHYGLVGLVIGVVGLGVAFVQTNRMHNQAVILDYKMGVIEQKLLKTEELERERIAYSATVSRDLKEIKGYVQGVSDKQMKQMVERMPIEFK